jgi:hypothetical protein
VVCKISASSHKQPCQAGLPQWCHQLFQTTWNSRAQPHTQQWAAGPPAVASCSQPILLGQTQRRKASTASCLGGRCCRGKARSALPPPNGSPGQRAASVLRCWRLWRTGSGCAGWLAGYGARCFRAFVVVLCGGLTALVLLLRRLPYLTGVADELAMLPAVRSCASQALQGRYPGRSSASAICHPPAVLLSDLLINFCSPSRKVADSAAIMCG